VLLLLCTLFSALPASSGTLSIVSNSRWVDVGRILDGDTFVSKKGEHIRLLGINTPEVAHEASPAQPLGETASAALSRLIAGKSVRLEFDTQQKDDYRRTLAHVYLRDGTWVNGEMVRLGMAHVYTFTPNLGRAARLIALESIAREANTGIWATERFAMLDADKVKAEHLGQFRVIKGQAGRLARNHYSFYLKRLKVSIPRRYRSYFNQLPVVSSGETVVVHGVIRASSAGLYVALHSPFDVEKISP